MVLNNGSPRALKALQRRRIRVPEDIAICGFEGIAITQITEPEITTVAQPIYNMGALATNILIEKITGGNKNHETHELNIELIIRKSSERGGD